MTESCSSRDGDSPADKGITRKEKTHDGFGRFGGAPWGPSNTTKQGMPADPSGNNPSSGGICDND